MSIIKPLAATAFLPNEAAAQSYYNPYSNNMGLDYAQASLKFDNLAVLMINFKKL